jgi:putative sterol carrier protein
MNAMEMWQEIKDLCERNEELQEELELLNLRTQQVYLDTGYKFWVILNKDGVQFGEGEIENPDLIFSANEIAFQQMIDKEAKGGELFMSGDLKIDGSLSTAIAYGSFLGLANSIFEEEQENA